MERRTALALAAAAATVMAAGAAFAANVGLLQNDNTKPVGVFDTTAIDATSAADPIDPAAVTVIVQAPAGRAATATGSGASDDGTSTSPSRDHDDDD